MGAQANLERLATLQTKAGGDMREAVRRFTGKSLLELAREVSIRRSDLGMCLGFQYGRTYAGIRRALELHLDLPQYSLDGLIAEHVTTTPRKLKAS